MKVKISTGKEYEIKELKYADITGMDAENKPESAKQLILKSTGMSEDEFNNLSLSDGMKIQQAINELNGLTQGFTKPDLLNKTK